MKHRVSCTYVAAFVAVFSAFPVHASDWAVVPAISTTLAIRSGRLCVGDGSRRDIGCPTFAPSVTTAGDVSITGNPSANKFIGDSSGLTGIGQGDRITSGTTSVIASEDRSVTITTNNTAAVTIGESGYVGVGTETPAYALDVNGTVRFGSSNQMTVASTGSVILNNDLTAPNITNGRGGQTWINLTPTRVHIGQNGNAVGLDILQTGNVGIGTTSPAQTLSVSGTVSFSSATAIGMTATPSATLDVSGSVKLAGTGNETNVSLAPFHMSLKWLEPNIHDEVEKLECHTK